MLASRASTWPRTQLQAQHDRAALVEADKVADAVAMSMPSVAMAKAADLALRIRFLRLASASPCHGDAERGRTIP